MLNLIRVRDYCPSTDDGFIYSTLINGLYYGDSWFSKMKKSVFVNNYRKVVEHALSTHSTDVRIACIHDDPDEIKGYAVLLNNKSSLMWVYVKPNWRKAGIAKTLIPIETVTSVSNLTLLGESLLKKYPNVSFNPFV